jgi:creatinine amidohydrolase
VVELRAQAPARVAAPPRLLAFGVDTTVEQHGPHLPLGTDTVQTYAVLQRLQSEFDGMVVGPPLDYGHLTWGLPFGLSINLTAPLTAQYMTGFVNALIDWLAPEAVYVADVHGSLAHRNAIQEGLRNSRCARWAFRWVHEPLAEFAGARGDMHAGGVETTLVHAINPELVDGRWWPEGIEALAAAQMDVGDAVELSTDLPRFVTRVEAERLNGIVGDIRNRRLDGTEMMERMMNIARRDIATLVSR